MPEEQILQQPIGFDGIAEEPKTATAAAAEKVEEKKVEEKAAVETPVIEEEVLDTKDYIKQRFGWDSEEAGLEELKTLREKAQTPAEIKFANEQSRKYFDALKEGKEDDIYQHLHEKKELNRAEKLDLTKTTDAVELIRVNLSFKYKDLSADEIQDIISETYNKPAKPQKALEQEDDEFQEQLTQWKQQCDAIDKRVIREAKMAKPELAKYKSELVLPDIPSKATQQQQAAPTQEELAGQAKAKDAYLKSMNTVIDTFDGHKITYKDEAVELPISYDATPEEKAALKPIIEGLYSSYGYFDKRWSNPDGTINYSKVMKDIHLLENEGKILQKISNESGSQRMKHQVKVKSNIDVDGGQTQKVFTPDANALQQKKEDAIWGVN